jgi:DNA repair exonuclease SbcCD ATPase subunit
MSSTQTIADAERVSDELARVRNQLARVLARLEDVRTERDEQRRLAEHLQTALENNAAIEQAIGIIAEKAHVDVTEARAHLKSYSRGHAEKLRTIAHAVVDAQNPKSPVASDNPKVERIIASVAIPAEFWKNLTLDGAIFE